MIFLSPLSLAWGCSTCVLHFQGFFFFWRSARISCEMPLRVVCRAASGRQGGERRAFGHACRMGVHLRAPTKPWVGCVCHVVLGSPPVPHVQCNVTAILRFWSRCVVPSKLPWSCACPGGRRRAGLSDGLRSAPTGPAWRTWATPPVPLRRHAVPVSRASCGRCASVRSSETQPFLFSVQCRRRGWAGDGRRRWSLVLSSCRDKID